jgi:IS30 family transposase
MGKCLSSNENTNGLIRLYLPKGTMAGVTQSECDLIAEHLNNRPRKRHDYKTPNQCFLQTWQMLHYKVEPRRWIFVRDHRSSRCE